MLLPYKTAGRIEAGCDEAGRGCLAGPVFAAAVILPPDFCDEHLNDSKQLTERQRYALRPVIEEKAIAWGIGIVTPEEIDKINILKASFLAMHRAIDALSVRPEALLIDGNRFTPYHNLPYSCEVKGDGRYLSIAAAVDPGQDLPRRLHDAAARGVPAIPLGRKQRLPHPGPPSRHCPIRPQPLPPHDIQPVGHRATLAI